jgi:hypothetical protein
MYNNADILRQEFFTMDYVTPKDKANEWGLTQRRVEVFCDKGRIPGAYRLGRVWAIPKDAVKPMDGRTKAVKKKNRRI